MRAKDDDVVRLQGPGGERVCDQDDDGALLSGNGGNSVVFVTGSAWDTIVMSSESLDRSSEEISMNIG